MTPLKEKLLSSPLKLTLIALIWVTIAIALWQSWLPYLAERHYRDGFNYNASKYHKEAIHYLEKAVAYAPWETQYLTELAKAYEEFASQTQDISIKKDSLTKAEALYLTTIKIDPLNPWFYNRYGSLARVMAQVWPEKASHYATLTNQLYVTSAKYDPQNPLFQLNLAYHLHQNNQLADAETYYLKAIEMDPNMDVARFNLANIYYTTTKYDKAIEQYLAIHTHDPSFKNLALAIALVYSHQNRYADALPYLEEALKFDPNNFDVLKNLSTFYHYIQAYDKAIPIYEDLFKRFPSSQETYYENYMRSLLKENQIEKSIHFLTRYTTQFPNDTKAKNQLAIILASVKK